MKPNPFERSPGFPGIEGPSRRQHVFGLAIVVVLLGLPTTFPSIGQSLRGAIACISLTMK